MSVVVVKREGEEGEITLSEKHERKATIITHLITASVIISVFVTVLIFPFASVDNSGLYTLIFFISFVYAGVIGANHFLHPYGYKFTQCYYIRSYYMSKTIPKTSDQKAICGAVREIDEETQKALERARLEKARLQVVANRCK